MKGSSQDGVSSAGRETFAGGCHCGAVRFELVVTRLRALRCNCSICHKKGFLHVIVPRDAFVLLQGRGALSSYRFNTGVAEHLFCARCGVQAFYTPRSHPDSVDVNLRCLDGDPMLRFEVVDFDGQNWEQSAGAIT